MIYRDDISAQLRQFVRSDGRTGRDIAHLAGIHENNLSNWLGGHRGLSCESMERLAGVLGVEIVATVQPRKKTSTT